MDNPMMVYLAGPINGCTEDECTNWREEVVKKVHMLLEEKEQKDFLTLDPMRRDFRGKEGDHTEEIVEGDLVDIQNSSLVLANTWQYTVGTSMEIFYAKHVLRKKVLIIHPPGKSVSPWLKYHSDFIVNDLDSAAAVIVALLRAGLQFSFGKNKKDDCYAGC